MTNKIKSKADAGQGTLLGMKSGRGAQKKTYANRTAPASIAGWKDEQVADSTRGRTEVERRYKAPALEKGLDVLELLATERRPLPMSELTQRLGRSTSEIYRTIHVLEYREFITQSDTGEGYVPTDKLFDLGMEQVPQRNLVEVAIPIMRELSASIGQSCHLAVRSRSDIVVIARMESAEQIGFTVRIGYRRALPLTRSGTVLFAFQEEATQKRWVESFKDRITPIQIKVLEDHALGVAAQGFDRAPSDFVAGVTDLSAPVLRGKIAAAALTVPFVNSTPLVADIDRCLTELRAAAATISQELLTTDHRV